MDTSIVFSKTHLGEQAIVDRSIRLDRKLKLALILVDGQSDIERLHSKAMSFDGLEKALEQLALNGFIQASNKGWQRVKANAHTIEITATEVFDARAIKAKLVDAAILVLGQDATRIITYLREAPNTLAGLEAAIIRCKKIVDLTIDQARSAELKKLCLQIIGKMA